MFRPAFVRSGLVLLLSFADSLSAQVPGREVVGSSDATQIRMEAEGGSAADPTSRIQGNIRQWTQTLGAVKPGSRPQSRQGSWANVVAETVQFTNEPKFLHVFTTTDRSSAICHIRAQSGFKVLFTIQGAMQHCTAELQAAARTNSASSAPPANGGGEPSASTSANRSTRRPETAFVPRPGSPPPALSADQPPAHGDNWDRVADVLFRSTYTGGVGGMVVIDYEPLILFKDGSYFEIANQALEDVDLAQEKAVRPVHWGTWTLQGGSYIFTDNKGRPHDYQIQEGSLFKTFPAEAGGPLAMGYKRVTGGGNSALGGEMSILVESRMAFTADGRFGKAQDVGMTGSGDQSGVSMGGGSSKRSGLGTYKVHGHTIELRYPDGHSERRFFAYSSAHTPAVVDRELIFISDSSYVHDK